MPHLHRSETHATLAAISCSRNGDSPLSKLWFRLQDAPLSSTQPRPADARAHSIGLLLRLPFLNAASVSKRRSPD